MADTSSPGNAKLKESIRGLDYDAQAKALEPGAAGQPVVQNPARGGGTQATASGPIPTADVDRTFNAHWTAMGGKPEHVKPALERTKALINPRMPPGYMPPPWRNQGGPSQQSTAPAAPIGQDPNGQSVDPDATARAQQNTVNDEYTACMGNGGNTIGCANQVTQGSGMAPDLAGGQSMDPNAGQSSGQKKSAPSGLAGLSGTGTVGTAADKVAGTVSGDQSSTTFEHEDKEGMGFEFSADAGGVSGRLSYSKDFIDKAQQLCPGLFLTGTVGAKVSGGVEKKNGTWSGNLQGEVSGEVTLNVGVNKVASAYAGGKVAATVTALNVSRDASGNWAFEPISPISLTVALVAGLQVEALGKIEHSPGGAYEILSLSWSNGQLVASPGKDVQRIKDDATSVARAMGAFVTDVAKQKSERDNPPSRTDARQMQRLDPGKI